MRDHRGAGDQSRDWSSGLVVAMVVSTLGIDAILPSGRRKVSLFDIVNGKRCVDGGVPLRPTTCTHPKHMTSSGRHVLVARRPRCLEQMLCVICQEGFVRGASSEVQRMILLLNMRV